MPSISNEQRIAIAIGVPVVAILLYFWLRRRQSAEFSDESGGSDKEEESEVVASANERTIEVKIPQSVAGVIIGKSGANIKKLEKESGARVTVKDVAEESEGSERIVLIQGERERAKRAEILVKKTLAEQPVVRTDEIFVPQRACGRIIGKGGQNIRHMSSVSGAKIKIDRDSDDMSSPLRRCFITGNSDQIAIAKGLLHEKVAEDKEMRTRREFTSTSQGAPSTRKTIAIPASVSTGVMQFPKSEEFCEVFLSAIDNAGHFWVQLVTTDSPCFDKLTEELTSLYAASESQAILNAFKVGDICCAPFEYDSSWYRARVLEIHKDEMVDLFYVDFGDTGKIPKERIRELKKEHRKLPFQAIECFLANVRPKDESWTEESTAKFERLTHCAQWVPLMARALKYCGQIPCLELIDTTGQPDVNINEEMIKGQYAIYDASYPLREPSSAPLNDVKISAEELPVTSAENVHQRADNPSVPNGHEETPQRNRKTDVLCEPPAGNPQDVPDSGVPGEETVGSTNGLQGPVPSREDSPVKEALVKRISQDYSSASESSLPGALSDDAQRAVLGVPQEQELKVVSESVVESQQDALAVERVESDTLAAAKELPVTSQDKVGYRSTLNIIPSSKRTIAATFSGNRVVPDNEGTSVKTVSSTVHRQVVSSKQSFVSSVTLPAHKVDELSVSISSNVGQLEGESPFASDSAAFGASNESSSVTRHAVASEIHRAVTQTNGSEAKALIYSSRFEQQSQPDEKPRLTYKINFDSLEGAPGMESYTITKMSDPSLESVPDMSFDVTKLASRDDGSGEEHSWSTKTYGAVFSSAPLKTVASEEETVVLRVSEHAERSTPSGVNLEAGSSSSLTPSGSLMDISSNTVIAEEEEYEEEEEEDEEAEKDDAGGKNSKVDSESPEPDSDTESFMSAREEMTSDTDTGAYITAQPAGSSTSLDTDVPVADSAAEEATTPVNSDTEREDDGEEEDDEGLRGPGTPRPTPATADQSRTEPKLLNALKSLQEQTALLGATVASDGDLGYRGDSEEGLASAEDLRETGRY